MRVSVGSVAAIMAAIVAVSVHAVSIPGSTEAHFKTATGVFRGEVTSQRCYRGEDGRLHTETMLRVVESFKGAFPAEMALTQHGGQLGNVGEADCETASLRRGEDRLYFVQRDKRRRARLVRGEASAILLAAPVRNALRPLGAIPAESDAILAQVRSLAKANKHPGEDFSDLTPPQTTFSGEVGEIAYGYSTTTNLMEDNFGVSARLLWTDRGEAVPYFIDAECLPTGVSRPQAVQAVESALSAWSAATSIRFAFAGFRNYGMSVGVAALEDGALHIQLHDAYNFIEDGGEIIGRGGMRWLTSNLSNGWTMGGNVAGNDFHKSVAGWVVLKHTSTFLSNLQNLAEVLCHEIGHSLALNHSSNLPTESSPLLSQAIMYYAAHGNQRGAVLNAYDTNVIRQLYPVINTPPHSCNRFLDVVTGFNFNTTPFNTLCLRGYDQQSADVTLQLGDLNGVSGAFSISNGLVAYTPKETYDVPRIDPSALSYYDILHFRYSDGTNASPYYSVRVVSFSVDRYNEGIPDSWRQLWFGNANPNAGSNRHANDDCDGDGFTNLQEFRMGSSPVDKKSNLALMISPDELRWTAKPFDLYEVMSTADPARWPRFGIPVVPSGTNAVFKADSRQPRQFYRVIKPL